MLGKGGRIISNRPCLSVLFTLSLSLFFLSFFFFRSPVTFGRTITSTVVNVVATERKLSEGGRRVKEKRGRAIIDLVSFLLLSALLLSFDPFRKIIFIPALFIYFFFLSDRTISRALAQIFKAFQLWWCLTIEGQKRRRRNRIEWMCSILYIVWLCLNWIMTTKSYYDQRENRSNCRKPKRDLQVILLDDTIKNKWGPKQKKPDLILQSVVFTGITLTE